MHALPPTRPVQRIVGILGRRRHENNVIAVTCMLRRGTLPNVNKLNRARNLRFINCRACPALIGLGRRSHDETSAVGNTLCQACQMRQIPKGSRLTLQKGQKSNIEAKKIIE